MNMIQRIEQLGLDVWLFMRPLINKSSRWGPVGADMTGREQTDQFLYREEFQGDFPIKPNPLVSGVDTLHPPAWRVFPKIFGIFSLSLYK